MKNTGDVTQCGARKFRPNGNFASASNQRMAEGNVQRRNRWSKLNKFSRRLPPIQQPTLVSRRRNQFSARRAASAKSCRLSTEQTDTQNGADASQVNSDAECGRNDNEMAPRGLIGARFHAVQPGRRGRGSAFR